MAVAGIMDRTGTEDHTGRTIAGSADSVFTATLGGVEITRSLSMDAGNRRGMDTMAPVRYGVIGAGAVARHMARAFTEQASTVAVAVADVDIEAARSLAPHLGTSRVTDDYRSVFADPGVDAVYLAVPPYLHCSMTLEALAAGKHVCCEKPFMLTQLEVRRVIAARRNAPHLKVTCNSSRVHHTGQASRVRGLIGANELGEVYRVHFEHVTTGPVPGAKLPAWRNDPAKNGGGLSFDWGPYDLDWLSYVLGDRFRPKVVFGTMGEYFPLTPQRVPPCLDVDGHFAAEIICERGLAIHWERRASEHGPSRHLVEIRGTLAGLNLGFVPTAENLPLTRFAYQGADELKREILDESLTTANWQTAMTSSIHDLTAAIRENREPSNDLSHNLRIHGVLDALVESSRTLQSVRVDS